MATIRVDPGDGQKVLDSARPGDRIELNGTHGRLTVTKGGQEDRFVEVVAGSGGGTVDAAGVIPGVAVVKVSAPRVYLGGGLLITNSAPMGGPLHPTKGTEEPYRGPGVFSQASKLVCEDLRVTRCGHGLLLRAADLILRKLYVGENGCNQLEHGLYINSAGTGGGMICANNIFHGSSGDNIHIAPNTSSLPLVRLSVSHNLCTEHGARVATPRTVVGILLAGKNTTLYDDIAFIENEVAQLASYPANKQFGLMVAPSEVGKCERVTLLDNVITTKRPLSIDRSRWGLVTEVGNSWQPPTDPAPVPLPVPPLPPPPPTDRRYEAFRARVADLLREFPP